MKNASARFVSGGGMICVALLLSLSGCQTKVEPCDCDRAKAELETYTMKYFDAVQDRGMLREQLSACQRGER
jgi:hypothetical protein